MRAFADNFTLDEIKFCCGYARKREKGLRNRQYFCGRQRFEKLPDYISALDNCGADALIVSDAGLCKLPKRRAPPARCTCRRRQTAL
ncbi:MAG: U32 family peptidase [Christensenellales bacterium]